MNNQQQIKQIETKIKNIIALIKTRKEELSTYESTLLALAQKLEEIKTIMKNNIKNNSLNGSNNSK